jgi:hypothetical protein
MNILHERQTADRVASAHFVGRNPHANLLPSQPQWCLLDREQVSCGDLLDLKELGLENDREENGNATSPDEIC